MSIKVVVAVAALLWLGIGLVLAELINLDSCKDLKEGLQQYRGRVLTPQEELIKLKLEAWLKRARCNGSMS